MSSLSAAIWAVRACCLFGLTLAVVSEAHARGIIIEESFGPGNNCDCQWEERAFINNPEGMTLNTSDWSIGSWSLGGENFDGLHIYPHGVVALRPTGQDDWTPPDLSQNPPFECESSNECGYFLAPFFANIGSETDGGVSYAFRTPDAVDIFGQELKITWGLREGTGERLCGFVDSDNQCLIGSPPDMPGVQPADRVGSAPTAVFQLVLNFNDRTIEFRYNRLGWERFTIDNKPRSVALPVTSFDYPIVAAVPYAAEVGAVFGSQELRLSDYFATFVGSLGECDVETELLDVSTDRGFVCNTLQIRVDGNGRPYVSNPATARVGSLYALRAPSTSWASANDAATLDGGQLATVADRGEQLFLSLLAQSAYRDSGKWLGGHQPEPSSPPASGWVWASGETFDFTDWSQGEPDDGGGNEDAVQLVSSNGGRPMWEDVAKSEFAYYIVEYDDTDGDSVRDAQDNCLLIVNRTQRDTDWDGIGNACDPDISPPPGDCVVNFADLGVMKGSFFSAPGASNWNADADLNGDAFVNFSDLATMKLYFFGVPGPSADPNDCGS